MALMLFGLQFWVKSELLETSFVSSARFLFWWYVSSGVLTISIAALAWAGDLGTEGARLRHGVSSSLGWMLGLARVSLSQKRALYFLMTRRLLLGVGAFLLMQGLQPAGAIFSWDEAFLWAGGVVLGVGLFALVFVPLMREARAGLTDQISQEPSARPTEN